MASGGDKKEKKEKKGKDKVAPADKDKGKMIPDGGFEDPGAVLMDGINIRDLNVKVSLGTA